MLSPLPLSNKLLSSTVKKVRVRDAVRNYILNGYLRSLAQKREICRKYHICRTFDRRKSIPYYVKISALP
jgi:hypothetical protein